MARDKSKKKGFYAKKNFLNKAYYHSDASIYSEVTVEHSEFYIDGSAVLKISDCNKSIFLEVGIEGNDAAFNNVMYKLDTLISHLEGLRDASVEARNYYVQQKKIVEANKRRRDKEARKGNKKEGQ